MRLLFATSIKSWGGGEEWMLSAASGLSGRGHGVALGARPGSAVLGRARAAGLPVIPLPFRFDADGISFARVYHHCRRQRVEALCLNTDRVLRVGGIAARLAGVRAVLPRRGSEFSLKDGALYRLTYRKVATGMIVNSQATARALCRDIPWRPAGRTHILPNGLRIERFERTRPRQETRARLDIPPEAPVISVIGELTARKNALLLIEVAARLVTRFPDLRILLAGEGSEEGRLRSRARELGILASVRFLGFCRDVPDLLAASDLLVHPSLMEGFGYAVAEAMAAGLPVVATNVSSIPEIVEDGRTGILFPAGDGRALEEAAGIYLADPERRARDGRAGRERARREFSFTRRLDELERILEEEIARGGSSAS